MQNTPSWLPPIISIGTDPGAQMFTQGRQFERNLLLSMPQIKNVISGASGSIANTSIPVIPHISTATLPNIPLNFNINSNSNTNPTTSNPSISDTISNPLIFTSPGPNPSTTPTFTSSIVPSESPILPPQIAVFVWDECGIARLEFKRVLAVIGSNKKCNRSALKDYFVVKIQKLLPVIWKILGKYTILKKGDSERAYWNVNKNLWTDFDIGLLKQSKDISNDLLYGWPASLCRIWDEVVAVINGKILTKQQEEVKLHQSWQSTAVIDPIEFDIESSDDMNNNYKNTNKNKNKHKNKNTDEYEIDGDSDMDNNNTNKNKNKNKHKNKKKHKNKNKKKHSDKNEIDDSDIDMDNNNTNTNKNADKCDIDGDSDKYNGLQTSEISDAKENNSDINGKRDNMDESEEEQIMDMTIYQFGNTNNGNVNNVMEPPKKKMKKGKKKSGKKNKKWLSIDEIIAFEKDDSNDKNKNKK